MIEAQQIAEDRVVMPVLHVAQLGVHAGGQCLDPAGGGRADRQRGGPLALAVRDLAGQQHEQVLVRGLPVLHQDGLHRGAGPQPADHLGNGVLGQLDQFGPFVVGGGSGGGRLGACLHGLRAGGHGLGAGRLGLGVARLGAGPGGLRLGHRVGGGGFRAHHRGQCGFALGPGGGQLGGQVAGPAALDERGGDRGAPSRGGHRGPQADGGAVPVGGRRGGGDHGGCGDQHRRQRREQHGRSAGEA
ncbi:hypothetical protein [Kitasatospora acidiphila]|uniref:hypothetical protein n=1 Tax=Kitasatospora acidiphila TaxID=2567942 RepID=UPI001E3CCD07|nr:hypothetical protein [Kitasatospora acidiphila]